MKQCNICKLKNLAIYIDGSTKMGVWADMCLDCHRIYGKGLGLGKGQKFLFENNSYRKIEG